MHRSGIHAVWFTHRFPFGSVIRAFVSIFSQVEAVTLVCCPHVSEVLHIRCRYMPRKAYATKTATTSYSDGEHFQYPPDECCFRMSYSSSHP